MPPSQRFPILFTGLNRAMAVVGLLPDACYVEVTPSDVLARMGWSFQATIPRSAIQSVRDNDGRVIGWGTHGWRGDWLINGSSSNIVRVDVDPPVRATAVGLPIRLRILRVSLEDPAAFKQALEPAA